MSKDEPFIDRKDECKQHINNCQESDVLKWKRYEILKIIGAAAYWSWIKDLQLSEEPDGVIGFFTDNTFKADLILQKFGSFGLVRKKYAPKLYSPSQSSGNNTRKPVRNFYEPE
jgi:hypothetical protein